MSLPPWPVTWKDAQVMALASMAILQVFLLWVDQASFGPDSPPVNEWVLVYSHELISLAWLTYLSCLLQFLSSLYLLYILAKEDVQSIQSSLPRSFIQTVGESSGCGVVVVTLVVTLIQPLLYIFPWIQPHNFSFPGSTLFVRGQTISGLLTWTMFWVWSLVLCLKSLLNKSDGVPIAVAIVEVGVPNANPNVNPNPNPNELLSHSVSSLIHPIESVIREDSPDSSCRNFGTSFEVEGREEGEMGEVVDL